MGGADLLEVLESFGHQLQRTKTRRLLLFTLLQLLTVVERNTSTPKRAYFSLPSSNPSPSPPQKGCPRHPIKCAQLPPTVLARGRTCEGRTPSGPKNSRRDGFLWCGRCRCHGKHQSDTGGWLRLTLPSSIANCSHNSPTQRLGQVSRPRLLSNHLFQLWSETSMHPSCDFPPATWSVGTRSQRTGAHRQRKYTAASHALLQQGTELMPRASCWRVALVRSVLLTVPP